jgi:ubiquinone/menaquinone biosynthesis C-methylase UbiE
MPPPSASSVIEQILAPSREAWIVEPGIWSVLARGDPPARYDARAKVYDLVVGSDTYNRVLWGSSASKYSRFAESALAARKAGWHLDAGCGSLIFSAQAYARHPERPVVLVDQSLGMLREARSRLERLELPREAPLLLLQADIRDLPFRNNVFETVLSMGMLHLFPEPGRIMGELKRVIAPSGALFLSSLVLGRPVGNLYLRLLHFSGEVARPRSSGDVRTLVHRYIPGPLRVRQKGSMLFVEAGRPAP